MCVNEVFLGKFSLSSILIARLTQVSVFSLKTVQMRCINIMGPIVNRICNKTIANFLKKKCQKGQKGMGHDSMLPVIK